MTTISLNETLKRLTFPVAKQQVYLKGDKEIAGKKAVVRTDTGHILSIVSDNYQLLRNAEVFRTPLATLEKEGGFGVQRLRLMRDGAAAAVDVLSDDKYTVKGAGSDEVYRKRLVLVNSYNMSAAFQIIFGAWRQICKNGAGIWAVGRQMFRVIHRGVFADPKHVREQVIQCVRVYNEEFALYLQNISQLSRRAVATSEVAKLFTFLQIGAKVKNYVETELHKEKKATLLSVYNAYTQYCRDREVIKKGLVLSFLKSTGVMMRRLLEYNK